MQGLLTAPSHRAVIVFFVISGYVIAFSTLGNRRANIREYAAARLSRLYSVVIPALLLTLLLQWIGSLLYPEPYREVSRGMDAARYVLAALFLQNAWMLSAAPPTNLPLWSLSYEFWYYVIFGACVLPRSTLAKLLCAGAAAAMAGPNILLLMPAWLAGAVLFASKNARSWTPVEGAGAAAVGLAAMVAASTVLADLPFPLGQPRFFWSASFISDWIFAIGVALVIGAVDTIRYPLGTPRTVALLRLFGDYTFPVYLYHYPVIFFFTAVTGFYAQSFASAVVPALAILIIVIGLSRVTDHFRRRWRQAFTRLICKNPPRLT